MTIRANVIDMFHGDNHEELPNFGLMQRNGIIAIIHKIGQGVSIDPKLEVRAKACHDMGMPIFGYWFGDNSDAIKQADFALSAAHDHGLLGIALDYEKNSDRTMTRSGMITFLAEADAQEEICTPIYGGDLIRESCDPLFLKTYGRFLSQRMLWLAEYGPHEHIPEPWPSPRAPDSASDQFVLWQFSETGIIGGTAGHVDENYWPGDAPSLLRMWRQPLSTFT